MILEDLLHTGLDVVFCGTAVTKTSHKQGYYYASKGNLFYWVLKECGFTNVLIQPSYYQQLLRYGIGLTDLVKGRTGLDNELRPRDFDIVGFKQKIMICQPKVVCFNGKRAAQHFFGAKSTKYIPYGLTDQTIGTTKIFVAPSTGGQGRRYWDIEHYHELIKLIRDGNDNI